MGNSSRVKNAIKNVGIAGGLQIFNLILNFVSRTYFVNLLGNDYLSCDGLFTNILTVLSFSELGIGSAIVYSLYKPIAEDDKVQIGKLMNLFATAYRIIAVVISVCGVALIPFLGYLVDDVPDVKESITLLYLLFLGNTVASYIFGYKRSYLMANQENYIVVLVHQGFNTLKIAAQILLLYWTHNYILYLIITIVSTLLTNVVSTAITNNKYPWMNQYKKNKLNKDERKPIFSNIAAIFNYKLGSVILTGTSNIIISLILKTAYVGLVSNYNLVISAVQVVVGQIQNGLQGTVGNFNVTADEERKHTIFHQLFFISFWLIGFITIGLAVMLTDFVGTVWLNTDYIVSYDVVIALCLSFYFLMINTVPSIYRTTLGIFKEARMCPIYASIINIILAVVLGKTIGLSGVFFATAIARLLTFNLMDPYFVYKKAFGKNVKNFYIRFIKYFLVLVVTYIATAFVADFIQVEGFWSFILKGVVVTVVCNALFLLFFFRTEMFRESIQLVCNMSIIKKFKIKLKKRS